MRAIETAKPGALPLPSVGRSLPRTQPPPHGLRRRHPPATERRRCFGLSLGLCAILAACAPGEARDTTVRWTLSDGRPCIDTAVATIQASLEGQSLSDGTGAAIPPSACSAQPGSNLLAVPGVRPGSHVRLEARSLADSVLYRGDVQAPDPVPDRLDVILYYTGGQ